MMMWIWIQYMYFTLILISVIAQCIIDIVFLKDDSILTVATTFYDCEPKSKSCMRLFEICRCAN